MTNVRANKTPEEKKIENEETKARVKDLRANKTLEEKKKENEETKARVRNIREDQRKDPLYKQNVAAMKAKYRQKVFKTVNETSTGRHRVFLDTVRDGPIYGCVSCHRLLYNNGVVEINPNQLPLK